MIWAGESLFQPLDSKDFQGLHKSIIESVFKCEPDIRLQLFKNILLSGAGSMLEGLKDRTKRDLNAITSAQISPEVFAPADRRLSAWLGGSILTDISTFEHLWVT